MFFFSFFISTDKYCTCSFSSQHNSRVTEEVLKTVANEKFSAIMVRSKLNMDNNCNIIMILY